MQNLNFSSFMQQKFDSWQDLGLIQMSRYRREQRVAKVFRPQSANFVQNIITLMASLVVEIVTFGLQRTHTWLSKSKCIHNVSLFEADFRLEALFCVRTSSKMQMVKQRLLPVLHKLVLSVLIGWYCDANVMWFSTKRCRMPHATNLDYCVRHFLVMYALVSVIAVGKRNDVLEHRWIYFYGIIWRQRAHNHLTTEKGDSTFYRRNSVPFMQDDYGTFR